MQTRWFCEREPYCQQVLARHWPDAEIYDDIRELKGENIEPVNVLCGGFPCTDLSVAGKGAGLDGEQSGLWRDYARLIGELRPSWVIVENVPALLARGFGRVLGDLAALRYDAEWDCIPASAVGAPHRRDRIWVVAYPQCQRLERHRANAGEQKKPESWHRDLSRQASQWQAAQSRVCGVAHGVPDRTHRIRALGNALVPQIAELIGRRIVALEEAANG